MAENKFSEVMYNKLVNMLNHMKRNPNSVTDDDRSKLEKLYSALCGGLGISEHSQWRVQWKVEKWFDGARKAAGLDPDEIVYDTQNVILDVGANEMLKLISGTGGTAFDAANSAIYVGTDTSAENAAQNGVLATGSNREWARLDSGYPVVTGRQVEYRATFDENSANFAWNEASITNGTGTNSVSMNRKVKPLGTKVGGFWSISITISLVSA